MRSAQARQQQLRETLDAGHANPGEGTAGGLEAGPCGPERENQGRVAGGAEQCGQSSRWKEQASGSADPVVYAERTAEGDGGLRQVDATSHAEESQQPRKKARTRRGGLDDSEPEDIVEEEVK